MRWIEDDLNQAYESLAQVADTLEATDIAGAGTSPALEAVVAVQQHIHEVRLLDETGFILATAPFDGNLIDLDMSAFPAFQAVKATGRPYWSEAHLSEKTNAPVLPLSLPWGKGILVASLSFPDIRSHPVHGTRRHKSGCQPRPRAESRDSGP